MTQPLELLRAGCEILDPVLAAAGFRFELRAVGRGSGGEYARGEYVRGARRLELHFRRSLGLVAYWLGETRTAHESYMRAALGPGGAAAYPGFSADPLDGFRHLRQDLGRYGGAFLAGTDAELRATMRRAAELEARRARGFRAISQPRAG